MVQLDPSEGCDVPPFAAHDHLVGGRGGWRIDKLPPIAARQDPIRPESRGADEELVIRAKAGERAALESLLRGQYDRVFGVCRRMTGNDADAADAAQEALIAVARGVSRFDARSRFSTWVYRISVNCSIDELRRRRRREAVSLDASFRITDPVAGDPERVADRVDIDAALRMLPPQLRAAVVLRDLCGLDYAEIAEVLDVPAGTVRSRISRGRAALSGLLDPTRSEP